MKRISLLFLLFVMSTLTLTYNRFFNGTHPILNHTEGTVITPAYSGSPQIRVTHSPAENNTLIKLTRAVNTLKIEVAALKMALKQSRNSIPTQTTLERQTSFITADDQADIHAIEVAMEQVGEKRFNEQILNIEERFDYEEINADWSDRKARNIEGALNELLTAISGAIVHTMECRSTLCRLEIEYDDSDAQNTFEIELPMALSESLPRMSARHERMGNVIRGIYYLQDGDTEGMG